jgi:ParB-like chromosome segregation protein Spo0J
MTMRTRTVAPSAWRNRIVGTDEVAPDQLVANPANWRTHPGPQRDALRGSLATVGWVQQVMVNRRTGHVVDGHARVEEALSRSEPTVPVLYVDLDPEEEALVLATLDPIGAMATADTAKLGA